MDSWKEIWPQYLWSDVNTTKHHHLWKYIYFHNTLWADIFIVYIALKPISTFLRQFYPGDLTNFADNTVIFFFIVALIIQWFGQIFATIAPPEVFLHWQPYLMVPSFLFFSSFQPYFAATNLWMSCSLRH